MIGSLIMWGAGLYMLGYIIWHLLWKRRRPSLGILDETIGGMVWILSIVIWGGFSAYFTRWLVEELSIPEGSIILNFLAWAVPFFIGAYFVSKGLAWVGEGPRELTEEEASAEREKQEKREKKRIERARNKAEQKERASEIEAKAWKYLFWWLIVLPIAIGLVFF